VRVLAPLKKVEMTANKVTLVEVGPRDGFQSVGPIIPTAHKIAILRRLYEAGVRRVEATSFVSPTAVAQLADAAEVLAAAHDLPGLDPQVLVPTARQAERALGVGARHLAFVVSVSERHNQSNVRRTPADSVSEYRAIVQLLPADTRLRLNVATAFDCPYDGRIDMDQTLALLDQLVAAAPQAEVALCDTTGRVTPNDVSSLFQSSMKRFPQIRHWAFHGHDTYGLGAANALTAWTAGVRILDASISGLGGCPFAPGATGNVATEDLVWMFDGMGIETGVNLARLVSLAHEVALLPGAQTGGRVRTALSSRLRQPKEMA
jgi:hydroxymethylglutaryl-CoA lyase